MSVLRLAQYLPKPNHRKVLPRFISIETYSNHNLCVVLENETSRGAPNVTALQDFCDGYR